MQLILFRALYCLFTLWSMYIALCNSKVNEFGFHIASYNDVSASTDTITTTLYWNYDVFSCDLVPELDRMKYGYDSLHSWFICNTSVSLNLLQCLPSPQYKMILNHSGSDELLIDSIRVSTDGFVNQYEWNTFCSSITMPTNISNTSCINYNGYKNNDFPMSTDRNGIYHNTYALSITLSFPIIGETFIEPATDDNTCLNNANDTNYFESPNLVNSTTSTIAVSHAPTPWLSVMKKEHFIPFIVIIIIIIVVFICLCILLLCCFLRLGRKYKKLQREITDLTCKTEDISNALVVIIAIGDYENDENVVAPDIEDGYLGDIPVQKDVENLKELFNMLNYKIIPKTLKMNWKELELITYLKTQIAKELFDQDNELKYDGLIVCISCHGMEKNIITSDYRTIEKTVIHRIISISLPKSREIPRIFIYDSCCGLAKREYIRASTVNVDIYRESISEVKSEEDEKSQYQSMNIIEEQQLNAAKVAEKAMEMEVIGKGISLDDIATGKEWTDKTKGPDYKLAQISASNIGYQAFCDGRFGSLLIYNFTQKMKQNILNKENKTLGIIFEEIQNELLAKGKQHTVNIFNDGTRYLKLKKNKSKINKSRKVLLQNGYFSVNVCDASIDGKADEMDEFKNGLPPPLHQYSSDYSNVAENNNANDSNIAQCNECGEIREGRIDENDELFYCLYCWRHYTGLNK